MGRKATAESEVQWFTAARAAHVSGLGLPMVNYLCREEIVVPSSSAPRGHGRARRYSFGDLVALRLVARLTAQGVSVLRLRKAMQRLKKFHPEITLHSLPASHLITDGTELYLREKGEAIERLCDGQYAFAFVIELGQLRAEVVKKLGRHLAA